MDPLSDTFVQFESRLAQTIDKFPGATLRTRDLRQIIESTANKVESTANKVKGEHRWSSDKSAVRKMVKSLVRDAERSYSGANDVQKQEALFMHFGGIPEPVVVSCPFLVVRTGAAETGIFSFGNGYDREYLGKLTPRPTRAVILTRDGRSKVGLDDDVSWQETRELLPEPLAVESKATEGMETLADKPESADSFQAFSGMLASAPSIKLEIDYLGWTLTTERQPFFWGTRKCQVTGFLTKELPLREDDLLAADDSRNSPTKTLILKIIAVKTYNKGAALLTKRVEETINMIELEPVFEITSDYQGEVRPGDIDNYQLRLPSSEELRRAWRLPDSGLPLGSVETQAEPLTYYYPKNPADLIFQSVFVTGVQGSGKTTFVRLLIRLLSGLGETAHH